MKNKRSWCTRNYLGEITWVLVGQVASFLGTLFLVRVLTERLDPIQYGQLALGVAVAGLGNQVIAGGISAGINRFYTIAVEQSDFDSYLGASIKLMFYASLVSCAIGLLLIGGLYLSGNSHLVRFAFTGLVFSILIGCNGALNSIQAAARQRAIVAFHSALEALLKIPMALGILIWLDNSSTAVMSSYIISSMLTICSQFIFLHRLLPSLRTPKRDDGPWIRQIWAYSSPFSTWGIFAWSHQSSDRWALNTFSTMRDVGFYSVLFQLAYTPILLVTGLAMSFLSPILYQRASSKNDVAYKVGLHKLVWRITFVCLIITAVGFLFTYTLHKLIFKLLVSSQYQSVSYLVPWMVMGGGIFASGQMLSLKFMIDIKPQLLTKVKIGTALIGVILNIYFASVAGLVGIVIAMVAFSLIYFIWMAILSFGSRPLVVLTSNDTGHFY